MATVYIIKKKKKIFKFFTIWEEYDFSFSSDIIVSIMWGKDFNNYRIYKNHKWINLEKYYSRSEYLEVSNLSKLLQNL